MSEQMSLLSVEPTQGRTRSSDPQTSVQGARRVNARAQRRRIAAAFIGGREYVTADWLAGNDNITFSHRSAWSARCGDLVRDGYLAKSDPVQGATQMVLSYVLTDKGWAWARDITREVAA